MSTAENAVYDTQQYLLLPQPKLARRTRHTCCLMLQPKLSGDVHSQCRSPSLGSGYHGGLPPHCHDPLTLQSPPGSRLCGGLRLNFVPTRYNGVGTIASDVFPFAIPATNSGQTEFHTTVVHLDSSCVMSSKFHVPRFRHTPPPGSRTHLTLRKRIPTAGVLMLTMC